MTAPGTTWVQIGGRALEVLDLPGAHGRAPLVLLHEGLGSVGLWRDFPADLQAATGRRLIAFSRYGHGRSAPPPRPRKAGSFYRDEALELLPELLSELGASSPVLVGHSDGGSIALIHAAYRPVAGLVLLAPHVLVEDITVQAIRETREEYRHGQLRRRMARHHDDPDVPFWGWCNVWLDPEFRAWNLEADAARVTAPTLLIQGTEDPYGSLEQITRIEARVRGPVSRLALPGGHHPHHEHGARVVQEVAGFVRALPEIAGPGALSTRR